MAGAGLELLVLLPPLPNAGITGMYQYAWLLACASKMWNGFTFLAEMVAGLQLLPELCIFKDPVLRRSDV